MPQPTDTLARVTTILVTHLGVDADEVTPDASIADDLGADSLDVVEIVMACEEDFGVAIDDDDAEDLERVAQLVAYIDARRRP